MRSESDNTTSSPVADVVLDTCCLLNLAAIDGTLECLTSLALTLYVPKAVEDEGIYIRTAADSRAVQRIDLTSAKATGAIQICAPADYVEQALYVEFALGLGDGEAMALAIAKNRGWKVATDDRKARAKAESVGIVVVTTPEMVQRWASRTASSPVEVANALRRIEALARFVPAPDSPSARWWRNTVKENAPG